MVYSRNVSDRGVDANLSYGVTTFSAEFVTGIILPVSKHTTAVVGSSNYGPTIFLLESSWPIFAPMAPSYNY